MRNRMSILDLIKGIIVMSTFLAAILYVKSEDGKKELKVTAKQTIAALKF